MDQKGRPGKPSVNNLLMDKEREGGIKPSPNEASSGKRPNDSEVKGIKFQQLSI